MHFVNVFDNPKVNQLTTTRSDRSLEMLRKMAEHQK